MLELHRHENIFPIPEKVTFQWEGTTSYKTMWDTQEATRQHLIAHPHASGTIFLTEHTPTFTLGRGEDGSSFLKSSPWYRENGFQIVTTNRGGKITYHGPGQLVVYPVIRLNEFKMGVKQYVYKLEETMIAICANYNVTADRKKGLPGVWVGEKKIGSIGIHVRKQVSIHGFALNVAPDLEHFSHISPCGLPGVQMTSLAQETQTPITVSKILDTTISTLKTQL